METIIASLIAASAALCAQLPYTGVGYRDALVRMPYSEAAHKVLLAACETEDLTSQGVYLAGRTEDGGEWFILLVP